MSRDALQIRPFTDAEFDDARFVLSTVFADPMSDEDGEAERLVFEPERSRAAFDDGQMVATLGCYSFSVSVPGGSLPCAGTTWVGVLPTHRRQGVLNGLMASHLQDVAARQEPLAMLWASEASIYGRFGYGQAAEGMTVTVDSDAGLSWAATAPPPADRVRLVPMEDAEPVLQPIYEAARSRRPGMHERSSAWWRFQPLSKRPSVRNGAAYRHVAVAEVDGQDVAYAIYGAKESWGDDARPRGKVIVAEMAGIDGAAEARMWRYLCGVDLTTTVLAYRRPVDDPLPLLLANPRRAKRAISDALHVRIMDIPAALSGRSYAGSAGLSIAVRDELVEGNDATWRVEVAPEGALVESSNDAPDLTMDIASLGALYLGGTSLHRLAAAGLVEVANPDAADALDIAMRSAEAPWGIEIW